MSASVNQRAKGQPNQVSNGPGKEPMKEEFDAYLSTQPPQMTPWSSESVPRHHIQGGYGSAPMSSPNVADTTYMQSYYPSMSIPYLGQGLSEGAWSNGGDPVSFLGNYGQMDNNYMQGTSMFGGFNYQPGFSWEFPSGEYNAWPTSTTQQQPQPQQAQQQQQQQAAAQQQAAQQRKADERAAYDTGYYGMGHAEGYGAMNGDLDRDMKGMEQGLKGMSMGERGGPEMVVAETGHVMHDPNQGLVLQQQQQQVQQQQQQQQQQQILPPAPGPSQKKTWASIASQPAKPQIARPPKPAARAPAMSNKHNNNMDIGTWENKNGSGKGGNSGGQQSRQAWGAPRGRSTNGAQGFAVTGASSAATSNGATSGPPASAIPPPSHPVLDKLRSANQYNPKEFNLTPKGARYFIIKSYSEDDIHRSIKYSIWCSTEHGNKRLDAAYRERESKGLVYLFFSVNGSGHFCGMAQMMSPLDYNSSSSVWAQDKWKGQTEVKWIYVKDVPNSQLRHIRLENNENKPVTNSRDTQEVPTEKGKQVLKIIHNYRHTTSIFDDFVHYEKRQEEEQVKLSQPVASPGQQSKTPREEDQPAPPREQQGSGRGGGGGGGGRSRRGGGEGRGQYQSNGNAPN